MSTHHGPTLTAQALLLAATATRIVRASSATRCACLIFMALMLSGTSARALTSRDLSARFTVDGYTSDFSSDETVFGLTPGGWSQESNTDSKLTGLEIYQVRISWDAEKLYVAVEGQIPGNNVMLLMDTLPGRGLENMTSLNSWRRNIYFDPSGRFPGDEFLPDVFGATWDFNLSPRLLTYLSGSSVDDRNVGPDFSAAASLSGTNSGRAMEFAIPWRTVFGSIAGIGTRDTIMIVNGVSQVFHQMPFGVHGIKLAAVVTGGWDGSSSPDAAPDNRTGLSSDLSQPVTIDNYAYIDLDRNDDTGAGGGGPDRVPDWNVSPSERVSFRFLPPIVPGLTSAPGADTPHLMLSLVARPNPAFGRCRLALTLGGGAIGACEVHAVNGALVRTLRSGEWSQGTHELEWDGAVEGGAPAAAGVYFVMLRTGSGSTCRRVVLLR